jgi:dTDP-4-dehydrorhamnose 3,5-epimerase-like enzyme
MKFLSPAIPDAFVIAPELLEDMCSFFAHTWCQQEAATVDCMASSSTCSPRRPPTYIGWQ